MHLTAWRAWRRKHYRTGEPRDEDNLDPILRSLLATRRGAIAVIRVERRDAKWYRRQHTAPADKDAGYLHAAYGRKRHR